MTTEQLQKVTKSIQEKLGDDTSALINDDLATIILDNTQMNNTISNKDTTIAELTEDKNRLVQTNNKLFLQVGIGEQEDEKEEVPTTDNKNPFDYTQIFDEKGNFIK